MRIAVFSDSHGNCDNMVQAVEILRPDHILHLGDGWRDAEKLAERFPAIPLTRVAGNCDFSAEGERELLLCLGGKTLFLAHGHTLGVKSSLIRAYYTAQEKGADILLHGHTHMPYIDERGGIWMMNPGSIGDYRRPSYGLLTIEGDKILPSLYVL